MKILFTLFIVLLFTATKGQVGTVDSKKIITSIPAMKDAGSVISVSVSARTASINYTVKFGAVPPSTGFINYNIIP